MNNIIIEPLQGSWQALAKRPLPDSSIMAEIVTEILADVQLNGDAALARYSLKFDKYVPTSFLVSDSEIIAAEDEVAEELKAAISVAKKNIEKFHKAQLPGKVKKITTAEGVQCWRQYVPIETVGLYIPGGTAPLFSTLLMLAIPAKIAGCKNIIICTPAGKQGIIHPAIRYTAQILGLKNIYKVGGAQAIAAMAYGTESIPRVDKIFGPGNNWVTQAKKMVSMGETSIDMLAGPSELAVYADESCIPSFVAADLLSQAEHGPDSQVVLVAKNLGIVEKVAVELNFQLDLLSRRKIANQSLVHSRFIVIEDEETAFNFLNFYAPEHLIIASEKAKKLSSNVINAGSVFLGNYSSESSGDYASGTNHSLPTGGAAKTYSGVSVDSFVKKITFQKVSKKGIKNIGTSVEIMAQAEGLDAHRNAISIRLKSLDNEQIQS